MLKNTAKVKHTLDCFDSGPTAINSVSIRRESELPLFYWKRAHISIRVLVPVFLKTSIANSWLRHINNVLTHSLPGWHGRKNVEIFGK